MAKMLCAGGRLDSVVVAGAVAEITTAGRFDSAYADCALQLDTSPTNYWEQVFKDAANAAVNVVTGETLYCHFEFRPGVSVTVAAQIWALFNSAGEPWLSLRTTTTGNIYGIYYNSGTGGAPAWTLVGATFTLLSTSLQTVDVKLTLGSPHSMEFSVGGVLQTSGTFTQALLTALRSQRGYGLNGGNTAVWSQMMAGEGISTINGKVKYSRPSAAGTNSGWTGAFTDVNAAVDSTATVNSATSAALDQSYAMGDVTVPAGFVIKSVFHGIYAKNDGVSPLNIKSLLRSGGANYAAAANLVGIGTSFLGMVERYDNDPATAAPWTQANFNAVEAGYRSVA